jgi:peptidoglycan hydrolase-like protein with peptidoglycan-binding domain
MQQPAAATKLPTRPGQQTSGRRPDPAVLKIQQDLIAKGYKIKADGIMGPATQAAQKAAAGSNQSSAETSRLSRTAPGAIQQAATTAIDPTTQSVSQRLATGPSLIDQGRARLGIPAGGTSPSPMRESSFEESVDRMRRLSNMLKG